MARKQLGVAPSGTTDAVTKRLLDLKGDSWFSNFVGRKNPKRPALYEWFGDKADGTPPVLFDTGQVADWDASPSVAPDISGGYLGASGSGARASYYRSPSLGATVTEIGGRFVIIPGSATRTTNHAAVLGISTAPIQLSGGITVDMSCHALFYKEGWSYGVWLHGVGFAVLAGATYLVPLVDDGITEYEATVYINGNIATIFSPDGNVTAVTDSRIGSYAGQYCFWESFLGTGNTDDHNKFSHIWANTGTPKFKALEPVNNFGGQIINGFKAFINGIYANAIVFPTGASTGKAVISTDGGGTLGYKTLVVDGITDAVTDSAPSQNAVFDGLAAKQPLDSDLTTIAGLTATTDNMIQSVGSAWASRTPAQVRTALALVLGTNVQAWDADLDAIAALAASNDDIVQRKAGAWTNRTIAQLKTDLALITQVITNGVTTTAPSEDAVFDALALKQDLDSDLTTIAGLTATTDSFLQSKSSAWASRTIAQVKTDLGLTGTNSGDQAIPCDFVMIAQTGTRVTGIGDLAVAQYVGRAFTLTKVIYQFDTADASGNTSVETRRNGSQVTSSNLTVSAANQADGTSTDAARTATISQSFAVGDRITPWITAVGTTPGKGVRAYYFGTWN